MKVVIADDSSMMRERIKSRVRGFNNVSVVGEAGNGRTAMELLQKLDPDLIMLDLHMPEMGGIEVLRNLKEARMRTKVCILTNYSYPQYKERCLALGADYFLSKSDDFEKITSVIDTVLKQTEEL